MSWGSAHAVFDQVASALIQHQASDELMQAVLAPMIDIFVEGDWDRTDVALAEYAEWPGIVEAFAANNIHPDEEEDDA